MALFDHIKNGSVQKVRSYLQDNCVHVNDQNEWGDTPLRLSVKQLRLALQQHGKEDLMTCFLLYRKRLTW
jgi:hypothetical protein